MGNADQTQDSDLENSIASVFPDEDVDPERCHSPFDLNIKPDQVLSVKEHKWDQLLIYVLGKSFEREASYVSLHEAQELVQNFAFNSDTLRVNRFLTW